MDDRASGALRADDLKVTADDAERMTETTSEAGLHFNPQTDFSNRRAILAMLAGTACFVANDALVKFVRESMPASELMTVRGICATALLLGFGLAMREPIRWRSLADRALLVRAGFDTLTSMIYVTALAHIALANATAIFMSTPILLTLLAVLALGEAVSIRGWVVLVLGFAGVILILQPSGDDFNAWSLAVLLAALFAACRDLVTRRISRETSSFLATLSAVVTITVFSAAWGLVQDWRPIAGAQFAAIAAASLLLSCGYFFVTVAMREGEVFVVVPFRYSSLIFSSLLGFAIWSEIPNALAACGMLLTVLSSTLLIRRK